MTDISINEVDFYFIAPLIINDDSAFETNLSKAGWKKFPDEKINFDIYNSESIYETTPAFLGILKNSSATLSQNGICYVDSCEINDTTELGRFRKTFQGKELKFKVEGSNNEYIDGLELGRVMRIHISPDKKAGIFIIHFRLPQKEDTPLSEVITTNYWLHKTGKQSPSIMIGGKLVSGYETIMTVISKLINSPSLVASPYHPGRLLAATYIQVKTPSAMKNSELNIFKDSIAHLGLCKGDKYKISEEDKKDVHNLFDNILVHASPEGFCGAFQIIDGQQGTEFMLKSSTTFLKSYLPIYIECVLLDLVSSQLINRKHKNNLHELSEQFRELKLTQILPVSRYSHLLQLKRIVNDALSIMPKIESVSNYIGNIKEERNRSQERVLNSLLGFMGVGQVLFAILSLYQTDCPTWNTIAITLSALFFLMSVIIIVKLTKQWIKKE